MSCCLLIANRGKCLYCSNCFGIVLYVFSAPMNILLYSCQINFDLMFIVHKICHVCWLQITQHSTIYAHIDSLAFNAIAGESPTFNTDADAAHIFAASQSS